MIGTDVVDDKAFKRPVLAMAGDVEPDAPGAKRKKSKKDKKKQKKQKKRQKKKVSMASTPITLNGPEYDFEPVPDTFYDQLDPHNIAKEARAAELVPWLSELILDKESSKGPERDRLVNGYTFHSKFGPGDYQKVLTFNFGD